MIYDIAFLSRLIPKEMDSEVRGKMIGLMEDAAIAWQENIIDGIEKANGGLIHIINYLPINAYPTTYKDPFVKMEEFHHVNDATDINLGYCNIRYIKRLTQWIPLYKEIDAWAQKKTNQKKVLIAYTMYPEFMLAIKHVKKHYPNIITINIVVDLPEYTVLGEFKKSFLYRVYSSWDRHQAATTKKYTDGYVVITKQMASVLSKNKPFTIVEGVCTSVFPERKREPDGIINVLYAGKLNEVFGVKKLLDAFQLIGDNDFQLILCGIGDQVEEIKKRANEDNRIVYMGQLKRTDVLKLLMDCDIIVNPRENNGEYTKYSFPSKVMEALSSGVPFIGYKLDGIPDEYDMYINYPKGNTVEDLANTIVDVGKQMMDVASEKALEARRWVSTNKSSLAQGKKVIDLIGSIS